jgi:hypothetical protein
MLTHALFGRGAALEAALLGTGLLNTKRPVKKTGQQDAILPHEAAELQPSAA